MSSPYDSGQGERKLWYIVKRLDGVDYLTSERLGWVDPDWERTRPRIYRKIMEQCYGVIEEKIVGTIDEVKLYCLEHSNRRPPFL